MFHFMHKTVAQQINHFADVGKMVSKNVDMDSVDTSLMLRVAERIGRKSIVRQNHANDEALFANHVKSEEVVSVVDSRNMDSLLAWALFTEIDGTTGRHISYENNTFDSVSVVTKSYVIFGVELMPNHLKQFYDVADEIVIFAYMGSYEYLKSKKMSYLLDKVRIYWPYGDDSFEHELSDNSVAKSLVYRMPKRVETSGTNMQPYIEDVSRYVNAMTPRRNELQPSVPVTQAKLMDLHEQLQDLLNINSPQTAVRSLYSNVDTQRYLTQYRRIREDIQRSACREIYGAGPSRVSVMTINIGGNKFRDYLMVARLTEESFIGYHDMHHGRVWRVHCNNPGTVTVIHDFLKPMHTWMEGSTHCMLTHRPSFTP